MIRRGSVEGQLVNRNDKRFFGYKIAAINQTGEEIASTYTDLDGYFIIPDVVYGTVDIVVSKEGTEFAKILDVVVNDISIYLEDEIDVTSPNPSNN